MFRSNQVSGGALYAEAAIILPRSIGRGCDCLRVVLLFPRHARIVRSSPSTTRCSLTCGNHRSCQAFRVH